MLDAFAVLTDEVAYRGATNSQKARRRMQCDAVSLADQPVVFGHLTGRNVGLDGPNRL